MFDRLKQVFQKKPQRVIPDSSLRYVPRIPEEVTGYPYAEPCEIVTTQQALIKNIRQYQEIPAPLFDALVMPVIENFAGYVHLLPASESHHHRSRGGLFRHSLEVGLYALQKSKGQEFCANDWPEVKHDKERKWRLASFLAGLLHDIGKPYTDYYVTDKDGRKWSPNKSGIAQWLKENAIEEYFIEWRPHRGKRHEDWASHGIVNVVTTRMMSFLGDEIYNEMYEAIVSDRMKRISPLVMHGEKVSVEQNIIKERVNPDQYSLSVSSEKYILQALRRLARIDPHNQEGAYFWIIDSGLYVSWKRAVVKIMELLKNDNVKGVQSDPDALATILLERGFAEYYKTGPGKPPVNYWQIYPKALGGVGLSCLKFTSVTTIFTGEPPIPVEASVEYPEGEVAADLEKVVEESQSTAVSQSPAAIDKPHPSPTPAKSTQRPPQNAKKTANRKISWEEIEDLEEQPVEPLSTAKTRPRTFTGQPKETGAAVLKVPETPGWEYIKKALALNKVEALKNGDHAIAYPGSARLIGVPVDVMNTLYNEGLLKQEAGYEAKVNQVMGQKYLVLDQAVVALIGTIKAGHTKRKARATAQGKSPAENSSPPIEATPAAPASLEEDLVNQFLQQVLQGAGMYITEEITSKAVHGKTSYRIPLSLIDNLATRTGVSNSVLIIRLRKVPGFEIDTVNKCALLEVEES